MSFMDSPKRKTPEAKVAVTYPRRQCLRNLRTHLDRERETQDPNKHCDALSRDAYISMTSVLEHPIVEPTKFTTDKVNSNPPSWLES